MKNPYLISIAGALSAIVLLSIACSGSDDGKTTKTAAEVTESNFQLTAPFTETRPKVRIQDTHTCWGDNSSPPLTWSGAPSGTESFALIVEDLDHDPGVWVHWVIYDIPGSATELTESIPTSTPILPDGSTQGKNDFRNIGYEGPCPKQIVISWEWTRDESSDEPAHKYHFKLYALDTKLDLGSGKTKFELLDAMEGHILGEANTRGKYQVAPITPGKQDLGQKILGTTSDDHIVETKTKPIYNTRGDLITPTPAGK